MNCPACDSPGPVPVLTVSSPDGLLAKDFRILKCPGCGLGLTDPPPTGAELSALYSADYHAPEKGPGKGGWVARLRLLFLAHRFRRIERELGSGTLLDYGCGNGEFVEYARGRGVDAAGIEPNYASSSASVRRSLNELPPGARYGLATLWHVLEHMDSPVKELGALSERLDAGGRIFISVPNFDSWEAGFGGAEWFHLDAPRHVLHYTPRSLELVLGKSGLRLRSLSFSFGLYGVFGMFQTLLNLFCERNFLYYSLKRGTDYRRKMTAGRYALTIACHALLIPALLPLSSALAFAAALAGRSGSMDAVCERAHEV